MKKVAKMRKKSIQSMVFAVGGTVALLLGVTACSSQPDKAEVKKALEKEFKKEVGGTGAIPKKEWNKMVNCMASNMTEQGDPDDVAAFADGEMPADDVKPKDGITDAKMENANKKCVGMS